MKEETLARAQRELSTLTINNSADPEVDLPWCRSLDDGSRCRRPLSPCLSSLLLLLLLLDTLSDALGQHSGSSILHSPLNLLSYILDGRDDCLDGGSLGGGSSGCLGLLSLDLLLDLDDRDVRSVDGNR